MLSSYVFMLRCDLDMDAYYSSDGSKLSDEYFSQNDYGLIIVLYRNVAEFNYLAIQI